MNKTQDMNKYIKDYRINNLEKVREIARKSYRKNPQGQITRSRERYVAQRILAIQFYSKGSMSCNCCGEKHYQFLAIDHVDDRYGTGKSHRKRNGASLCNWLIKNGFPEGFRVLCHNCNLGRSLNGGICPHKLK